MPVKPLPYVAENNNSMAFRRMHNKNETPTEKKTGEKCSARPAVAVGDEKHFRHTTRRYTGRGRNQGQQDAGKVRVPRPAGEKNNAADVSIYASCNAGTPQQPRRFDS